MGRPPAHVRADDKQSGEQIPPLEPGDWLTRDEFERRYEGMPQGIKAELLEGVVHMPSLTRLRRHGRPHSYLITWLGYYESATPGVEAGDTSTTRLDMDNEPQPDAVLLIDPACGGQAHISADDYIEDAPEFVAEVASEVFPGLWLDTAALLRGDIAAVLATVQHGLASPDHETFVARLHSPSP